MTRPPDALARCLAEIEERGLLLSVDKELPSVTTIVAAEPVSGSWWKHPAGREIFRVQEALRDHDEVLTVRLVAGKITHVARRLWPALLAVGTAREHWQTDFLPPRETRLLALLDEAESLRVDDALGARLDAHVANLGKTLEARLLVVGGQTHMETGAHARTLTSWKRWARNAGVSPAKGVDAARNRLEAAARSLGPDARLPWRPAPPPRGR